MSQLTLTPAEDQIIADALRAKAASYTAMFGVQDAELEALVAKVEGQLPAPVVEAPVVEETPVVEEPAAEEVVAEEVPAEEE